MVRVIQDIEHFYLSYNAIAFVGLSLPDGLALWDLAAAFLAAAVGHPDRERCVLRLELTWPRPLQPGVGHFNIVSCNANTV